MVRISILIELCIFFGCILTNGLLLKVKQNDVVGRPPIHRLLFITGKLSMGASWGVLLVVAALGQLDNVSVAKAFQYVAVALLLPAIIFTICAFAGLGRDSRFGLSENSSGLKTDGIYQISRNPMYLGFYLVTLASMVAIPHVVNILCGLAGVYTHHQITMAEERFLLTQHGATYAEYMRKTRRYI